jgi:hypothetical protein
MTYPPQKDPYTRLRSELLNRLWPSREQRIHRYSLSRWTTVRRPSTWGTAEASPRTLSSTAFCLTGPPPLPPSIQVKWRIDRLDVERESFGRRRRCYNDCWTMCSLKLTQWGVLFPGARWSRIVDPAGSHLRFPSFFCYVLQ